jgi:hypothetical protein
MIGRRDDPLRDAVGEYRPLAPRRRLLIALLAAVTAIAVVLLLLHPPGGIQRTRPRAHDAPACVDPAPKDCGPDNRSVIMVVPVAEPGSSPRPTAPR